MNNIEIFRAKRGEGKTKWLVDRAIEAYDRGETLLYAGCEPSQRRFMDAWIAKTSEKCPVQNIDFYRPSGNEVCCVLTDDLIDELWYVAKWYNFINDRRYKWYMTIGQEYFVN